MNAKEYLQRVGAVRRELKRLEHEYEEAKADIEHLKAIDYGRDKINKGSVIDLSGAIARLEEYAARVDAKWDEMIALRDEAEARIDNLADMRYRYVLKQRYLSGWSWEQIAVGLGYSYRHVIRTHGQALIEFQKMSLNVLIDP